MILPANKTERYGVYRNVIRECGVSRETRRATDITLRQWYLAGSDTGRMARHNKLLEHLAFSSSYLYSPTSVRFGVVLPPHYGEEWIPECDAAKEELHRLFHDSDASLIFDQIVTWAHVYGTMIGKVIVSSGDPVLDLITNPSDIGVHNESSNDWDTQEAIVHSYYLELPRFCRMVAAHPRANELIRMGEEHAMPGYEATQDTLPPAIQRQIVLSQASPRDRKSTRLNSSHLKLSRMPSSA